MGEVYRAHDTKLHRDVAIKYHVIPDGRHFLMIKDDDQDSATSDRLVVVQACSDEVRRLASRS